MPALLILLLTVFASAAPSSYSCVTLQNDRSFDVLMHEEFAKVSYDLTLEQKCYNQTAESNLEFEIICEVGDELIAVMYQNKEGAIVSNRTGLIENFTCFGSH